MAVSSQYNTLHARLLELEIHLLPAIDPVGNYSAKDYDLIRSYCLLCHAEIEAYLEDVIWHVTTLAYQKWHSNKEVISPIIFHLAYSYRQEPNKPKEAPYSMIVKSYKTLESQIKKNNGIKEDNTSLLLKPIGFEMDPILQSTLDNFGKTRGQIAHTSFKTQQPLDPATEKANINLIATALKDFDTLLIEYEQNGTLNRTPVNMYWNRMSIFRKIMSWFCKKIF